MTAIQFSEFTPDDQEPIRRLILDGLGDHWGDVDESLNADLHDIADSYRAGRTIVGRLNSQTVATGTLIPDTAGVAQIVRMSYSVISEEPGWVAPCSPNFSQQPTAGGAIE